MAANILSAVEKKDVSCLVDSTKQVIDKGGLDDCLVELSRRQLGDFWDGVLSMCLSTLLANDGSAAEENLDQMCEVLHCITCLASATLRSVVQTQEGSKSKTKKSDEKDRHVPQSLQEAAIILHGVLPTLAAEKNHLKDEMSRLFEYWWVQEIVGREELMGNTVIYLLSKSTQDKSSQADVARVKAVQEVLTAIDLSSDNASVLVSLLLQCTFYPQFVTTPQGIKFLAFLFTLDVELIEKLHQSIKNHLPSTPKSWHSKYGEIYFRAWQKISDDKREKLEQYCIQDLMYRAVHINRDGHGSMAKTLFRVLSFIHKEKNQRGVEAMLARLYEPILWRSLMVANSDVRVNAATLMFDVFPLQDPALHNEQADAALQKQFDLMHSLLSDPVVEVRLTAVRGVGTVLNIFWELIPPQVIQCFLTALVQDLAYDISSPAIREAVIRVMFQLCDNHLCIPMLKKVLPELRNFVHDTSEKVRIAMFDLLLKVKQLRPIKFWQVVPVEHILGRLEVDSAPIAKRIMKLIQPSFVPLQQTPAEQMERCLTLIRENPGAARQLFLHLPHQIGLEDTVKYITMICKYVLQSARQLCKRSSGDRSYTSDSSFNSASSGNDSPAEQTRNAKKGKGSPMRKARRTGDSEEHSSADVNDNSDDDDDDKAADEPDNSNTGEMTMAMFRGLVEAIYLMYTVIQNELNTDANRPMSEGLAKKLSITVRELMMMSQDPGLDSALIALAGHLPSRALPLVSQNLLNRLKQGSHSGESMDTTSIVKSLVLWGKADSLIQMIEKAVSKVLINGEEKEDDADSNKPSNVNQKDPQKKKKGVAFAATAEETGIDLFLALDLLVKMITQVECRPMLLCKYRDGLMSIVQALKPSMMKLRDILAGSKANISGTSDDDMDLYVKLYIMYLRLSAFLCTSSGKKSIEQNNDTAQGSVDALKSVNSALAWTSSCVLAHVEMERMGDSGMEKPRSNQKREVSVKVLEATVKICSSLMMIGLTDASFLDQVVQLCMAISQTSLLYHTQHSTLASNMLACVYQLTQIRHPQAQQTPSEEDDAVTSASSNGNLACTCLCQFLKFSAKHMAADNETLACNKPGKNEKDDNDKENQKAEKDHDTNLNKNGTQSITSINSALGEIISELTRPGRPAAVAEKTLSSVLDCMRRETERYSEDDKLEEGEKLPPVTAALVSAVKKRLGTKRMFIKQLHDCLDSGEITSIHQIHGIVAVLAVFRQDSDDLVPPALIRSVTKALTNAPVSMDEDVYRDLKTQIEGQLHKWILADVGEAVNT